MICLKDPVSVACGGYGRAIGTREFNEDGLFYLFEEGRAREGTRIESHG